MTGPPPRAGDPRPSIAALLDDPAVRGPLKQVLRAWTRRDPFDAAEDAGLLALALERLADERAHRSFPPRGPSADVGGIQDRRTS